MLVYLARTVNNRGYATAPCSIRLDNSKSLMLFWITIIHECQTINIM